MGLGLIHYIPFIAYLGFWVMCLVSLVWRPLWGLYYLIPFLPYRSFRNHFFDYFMGTNVLSLLVLAVIVGALLHGKRLPKSKLYAIWLVIGVYLYFSMWMGAALGHAPLPLWLHDENFVLWKDYMVVPLVLVATSLVVEDRKAIATVFRCAGAYCSHRRSRAEETRDLYIELLATLKAESWTLDRNGRV